MYECCFMSIEITWRVKEACWIHFHCWNIANAIQKANQASWKERWSSRHCLGLFGNIRTKPMAQNMDSTMNMSDQNRWVISADMIRAKRREIQEPCFRLMYDWWSTLAATVTQNKTNQPLNILLGWQMTSYESIEGRDLRSFISSVDTLWLE